MMHPPLAGTLLSPVDACSVMPGPPLWQVGDLVFESDGLAKVRWLSALLGLPGCGPASPQLTELPQTRNPPLQPPGLKS